MLQRVGIAQALLNDPDLVIFDEPMSGLDPLGRRDVRSLILRLRDRGCTRIEATEAAQEAWAEHVADVGEASLFAQANSWYVGANIPGKARVVMPYAGGQPVYRERCDAVRDAGYEGFVLGGAAP